MLKQEGAVRTIDFKNIEDKVDFTDPEIVALQEAIAELRLENLETESSDLVTD